MNPKFEHGMIHLRSGRFAEAVDIFDSLLRENPDDMEAKAKLGEALIRQGRFEAARGHLVECVARNPEDDYSVYFLGVALLNMDRPKRARIYFETAARLKPDWHMPHYQLGQIYRKEGDDEMAIAHLKECCRLYGDFDHAVDILTQMLIKERRAGEAIPFIEVVLRTIPDHERMNKLLHKVRVIDRSLDPDQPIHVPNAFNPTSEESPVGGRDLLFSLAIHWRVVSALFLREIRTKFGRHQLGLLWAFLDPIVFVIILVVAFGAIGRGPPPGMTLELMLISGYVPWIMFTNTRAVVAKAAVANRPLLFYPGVVPFDLVVARSLVDYLIGAAMLLFMFIGLGMMGQDVRVHDPVAAIVMYTLMWLGGIGLGLATGPLALRYPSVENMVNLFLRLVFFTSGIFFLASDIPADIRHYAMLNPVMNSIDLFRDSLFSGYRPEGASWSYCLFAFGGILFLGLLIDRAILRPMLFKR